MADAPAAAFFDLDRTLISGSSAFSFAVAAWRNKVIPTSDLLRDGVKAASFKLFGATDEASASVRDRILQAVEGLSQDDLIGLNEQILPRIIDLVEPGGLLLYETFALGNEAFGRPRTPDFLLRPGELLEAVRGRLDVLAYQQRVIGAPRPAVIQHIAARRS